MATTVGSSSSSHKRKRETSNIYLRLMDRQIDSSARHNFIKRSSRERFSNISLERTLDMFKDMWGQHVLLATRHRIQELCCTADGLIFGLTTNGVCACFDKSGDRLFVLNHDDNEVVRSLFHNKHNDTLIAVSVFAVLVSALPRERDLCTAPGHLQPVYGAVCNRVTTVAGLRRV